MLNARSEVDTLTEEAKKEQELSEQVRKLAEFFDTEIVKQQANSTKEQSALNSVRDRISAIELPRVTIPAKPSATLTPTHDDLFREVETVLDTLASDTAIELEKLQGSLTKAEKKSR